jgi:hypothetical protein
VSATPVPVFSEPSFAGIHNTDLVGSTARIHNSDYPPAPPGLLKAEAGRSRTWLSCFPPLAPLR